MKPGFRILGIFVHLNPVWVVGHTLMLINDFLMFSVFVSSGHGERGWQM